MPQRNEGSPRDSKGTQSPRSLIQDSPKLCLPGKTQPDLNSSTSNSLEAGLGLRRNREPPAAVWGYHRHQYLQVHTCPENPWDGVASSSSTCMQMPLYSMHIQGCQCMLLHKYTNTLAYADTCTVTQAWACPSTNGTGDHPAGCDPLLQPPSPPWCRKGLGKEKIPFTTPTATQLTDQVLGISCGISCSSHGTTG